MIRAVITCGKCEGTAQEVREEIEAASLEDLGPLLSSLLVAWHATPPHCPHPLKLYFESDVTQGEPLTIRCLSTKCEHPEKEFHTHAPKELVGALTILFHSSHEAHPMEITFGDRTWRSPIA